MSQRPITRRKPSRRLWYRPQVLPLETRALPSFVAPSSYDVPYPNSVAVGDFNGDGISDLVTANLAGTVDVLPGNGDGTFQAAHSSTPGGDSVVVGDFNGDGILDLAETGPGENAVKVLLGNGDASFQPARTFTVAGSDPDALAVGDFNGDGSADLAVADFRNDVVNLFLGNGDGTFQVGRPFAAGAGPFSVTSGDFNGDGTLDLAVIFLGGIRALLGNGDGTFQTTPMSYIAGFDPSAVAVGDFNGDGLPDLAVANSGSNDVSILLNDGVWPAASRGASSADHRGRVLPASAGVWPSRSDSPPLPAAPSRNTAVALPPVLILDQHFSETPADRVADSIPRPLPSRISADTLDLRDSDPAALEWPV